jgi:hypothetical protein
MATSKYANPANLNPDARNVETPYHANCTIATTHPIAATTQYDRERYAARFSVASWRMRSPLSSSSRLKSGACISAAGARSSVAGMTVNPLQCGHTTSCGCGPDATSSGVWQWGHVYVCSTIQP